MDAEKGGRIAGGLAELTAGLSPMNSFTFLAAAGVAAFGAWVWFRQSGDARAPFPVYGTIAASYAGGFLIGRVFRKVLKTAVILAVIILAGFALLNRFHVDTSKGTRAVKAGSTWVQDQSARAKDYLLHLLPSGGAAGVGVFAGARRRRNDKEEEA